MMVHHMTFLMAMPMMSLREIVLDVYMKIQKEDFGLEQMIQAFTIM